MVSDLQNQYDYFLIDDDPILRKLWEISAKQNNIHLATIGEWGEFEKFLPYLNKRSTVFCVDYFFKEEEIGLELCEKISNLGFEKIYLSSGNITIDIANHHYIKGNMDKMPPWIQGGLQ